METINSDDLTTPHPYGEELKSGLIVIVWMPGKTTDKIFGQAGFVDNDNARLLF